MFNISQSPILRQYAVVITVNLSVLCVGLHIAWPSPVLVKLRNDTDHVLSSPITEEEGSWIVSIGALTSIFPNLLVGFLASFLGRKACVIIGMVPRLAVCLFLNFATEFWMILACRGILGVLDAFIFSVVPMYASEITSKEVRGTLGTFFQIFCSIGILLSLGMGPFVSYTTLNIIITCVVAVSSGMIFLVPDSPYFLYSKGRNDETLKVLTFLRGSEVLASEEIQEYSSASSNPLDTSKTAVFRNRVFLKTLGIVVLLSIGVQVVGFNAISFYLQTILESTHTSVKPEVASVILGLIQLTASLCTTMITDRFGRKPILSVTLVGMAIGMIGLGTFFKLRELNGDQVEGFLNYLPLISLIMVVYCFSAGLGSLLWVLSAELFDSPTRVIGVPFTIFTTTITMFACTKSFVFITTLLGPAVLYWIFSVNCILLCLFILFCVPETKGKTFAEIQKSLGHVDVDGKA